MKLTLFCAFFVVWISLVFSKQSKKTLVLYDNSDIKTTHSIFFKSLVGKLISILFYFINFVQKSFCQFFK